MPQRFVPLVVLGILIGFALQVPAEEMRVVDIPILNGATDVSIMKRRGDIRFQVPTDFKTTGNSYAKTLAELKWTKSGKDNLQRNFWVQNFSKNKSSLEVRVDSRGSGSEVRLTPKGLMWEEDDQPTPKSLPFPKDATEVEYDDFFESIDFKSPSSVKELTEFFTRQLTEKKWIKEATEYDLETFVKINFSHGKSTLSISIRAEDSGVEVAIKTKGMQWDGMKEEIRKAEQLAEETEEAEDEAPPTKQVAGKSLELPVRKERPKQGIEKLPKLPNEATVVMDGKKYQLTSIIAYEIYEDGQWWTRILATEKPIKQESLLANLKSTGTDKKADESYASWPPPYLQVTLDEDDKPWRLSLQADSTPGQGTGNEVTGTALVENGRARGTAQLKEPGDFFDKVYDGQISFDVPLLTRQASPSKRLADAPKLNNSGSLTIGEKTYKLPNVVAYEMKQSDEPMTTIVFSERALNLAKVKAALDKKGADEYFEFIAQVKLVVDAADKIDSIQIWADNTSISGNEKIIGDVVIEDGRARGTANLAEPGEFFDKKYTFELSFDTDVLVAATSTSPQASVPAGGLVVESHNGLPFPEGGEGFQTEGSKFRKQTSKAIRASLQAVVDFFRRELAPPNWTENKQAAKTDRTTAMLSFAGSEGQLLVQLKSDRDKVNITLVTRDAVGAKAAGVWPSQGKGRLLVGNASEKAAAVTINKKAYKVAAGAGADDPKTGLNSEITPGKYVVEIKLPGQAGHTETLNVAADETWGVVILPTGDCLPMQIY